MLHEARHAAPDLVDVVLALELADQPTEADHQRIGDTLMDCAEFNAEILQAFVDACEVFHVAGQAIQRLDDDDVEFLGLGILKQVVEAVPAEHRRTGSGLVLIGAYDAKTLALSIGSAQV
ncbi:MAG: hypothetical protein BGP16_13085 [Sphingobium sp. 66-54]|nr:MAG: hypothetical protein BGP16_13085 [Sphingobium sp. 66-54]